MKVKQKTPQAKPQTTEVAVVNPKSAAVSLPADWQEELANQAKDAAAKEVPSAQSFSTRGGILSYNGQAMPDNYVDVVIVGSAFINAMYINKFDPNNIVSPLCFSISENGEDMAPHENSFKPQCDTCGDCEMQEWGSDPNSPSGRGKMCKETRRLAVIAAEELGEEGGIEKAPIVTMNVPVTSTENWGGYVNMLAATAKRPPWSVVTRVQLKPHPKKQFVMEFSAVDAINDTETLGAIKDKRELGMRAVAVPFQAMSEEQYNEITAPKPEKKRKF